MKPKLSYTVWFSQRTGSTLFCKTLESTGIAGIPNEWLINHDDQDILEHYGVKDHAELQNYLLDLGTTPNGVFGIKLGFYEPYFGKVLDTLRKFPGSPQSNYPRAAIWQHAFPNNHHIFMTRRNKIRLAVSWWKAIKTQEWHREKGMAPLTKNFSDAYVYDSINYLYNECSLREAGIQEFFAESSIVPMTIFYEDFIQEYEKTVRNVLNYLELDSKEIDVPPPFFEKLADDTSEEWVQRFREEKQKGWQNYGW